MAKKEQRSNRSLVIVESPAKAKTVNRYLGSGFEVMASMGHIRDLPPSELGIDLENDFEPAYQTLAEKRRIVNALKKAAAKAATVYLATDLDREGEAIAWHLVSALDLDIEQTKRVVFNEITKSAIRAAFAAPHGLDMDKVNAQQARRLLDRIVGYQLSPLLQSKLAKGLSAGRVQSVTVRLIVEREREIREFLPEESWRIWGCFGTELGKAEAQAQAWEKFLSTAKNPESGRSAKERNTWLSKHACVYAELVKLASRDFDAKNADDACRTAQALGYEIEQREELEWEAYTEQGLKKITIHGRLNPVDTPPFAIKDIQKRRTTSRPSPPFTTAALQQAASSECAFAPSRTMRIAQQLYEGIELGKAEGPVGLITYMRTDSTNLSKDSIAAARQFIQAEHGDKYLPPKPNYFGKARRAQEAHEAIRPSDVTHRPEDVKQYLTVEQHKLYNLIWKRFVACQMSPAQWDSTTILIAADTSQGEAVFRTTGRRLAFDGYQRVAGISNGNELTLPPLDLGQQVSALQIDPQQQYTSPPPRYSEASLVKKLESEGIGRPSTYAAIIQTIQDRNYVDLADKRLFPTSRGEMVTEKLVEHFPRVMDVKFTSYMEEELDKIEEAHLDWVHVLGEFYTPFKQALDKAQAEMQRAKAEPSEYDCPECGKQMVYRFGKNGRFLSCSGYPDCKVARNIDSEGKPIDETVSDQRCPDCDKQMILRRSRLGPFLGCTGYPDCNFTMPCDETGVPLRKVKAEDVHETCDVCGSPMAVKFSRGKSFLGCTGYPKCRTTKPMPPGVYVEKPKPAEAGVRCDKCGRAMVIRTGRRGPFLSCSGFPRCRNALAMDKIDHLRELAEAGKIPDAPPESANGNSGGRKSGTVPRDKKTGKVDIAALGPPPEGFAWTRTGRPVVETWPEDGHLTCPDCGGDVVIKTGRFGPYFACTKYPKCSFAANLRGEAKKRAEIEVPGAARPKPIPTDIPCDECDEPMVIRQGRSGQFLGCSKYPKCKFSKPLPEGATAESLAATAK
ncbi:MAG: type I DNA topoisomerase [Phycisphaerales bacterium]|nr:MAG: type I DNA topoisomerase [Phycisphaerales bacterium]